MNELRVSKSIGSRSSSRSMERFESQVVSLNETTGFTERLELFQKNKHRKWSEWLKLKKLFRSGVQGVVGLFQTIDDTPVSFVFKIPKNINYLVEHELCVMKSTLKLADFCPHFCRVYGSIEVSVNPKIKKGDVFDLDTCTVPIVKDAIIMEYIDSPKFIDFIEKSSVRETDSQIYSCIKQVMAGLLCAQAYNKFVHYDCYCNNIMVKDCDKDLVMLYVINDKVQHCVPTYGKVPVFIDYGFSWSNTLDGEYLWQNMSHTNAGVYSDRFNEIEDFKRFLVTIATDVNHFRPSKTSKKLVNISKRMFKNFDIDWEQGWSNENGESATGKVELVLGEIIEENQLCSDVFGSYLGYSIDIIQSLIKTPLEHQDLKHFSTASCEFIEEFAKIEKEINSSYYSMYVLKMLVNNARKIRPAFKGEDKAKRVDAIKWFGHALSKAISTVADYVNLSSIKVDYCNMLSGLYEMTRGIEGLMASNLQSQMKFFEKNVRKLEIDNPNEMFICVDVNIEDEYEFNSRTTVMVVDCVMNKCRFVKLSKANVDRLNETSRISRATEMYDIINEPHSRGTSSSDYTRQKTSRVSDSLERLDP